MTTAPRGDRDSHDEQLTGAARARAALSRFWHAHFGGSLVRELILIVALLQLYTRIRFVVRDRADVAFRNAHRVLDIEQFLGPLREGALQAQVVHHRDLMVALNRYYSMVHFPATMLFVAWLYIACRRDYWSVRKIFVAVTLTALVIEVLFPLAPPRMMPGFVDTMARFGPNPYASERIASVANQYAAMPSLHVGWSILIAYGVITVAKHPLRWLIIVHPVITVLCVVLTANHYWLDGAVAAALVVIYVLAFRASRERLFLRHARVTPPS